MPPHAQTRVAGNKHPNRRPGAAHRTGGLQHDNTRHTTRFTVIGNHLAQHGELSLLAIGLGTHLQSLPKGAPADIKTLAARFPEGATRIAAALRELEAHGYLRRERVRTATGRIITRTISCNQPASAHHRPEAPAGAVPQRREACEDSGTHHAPTAREKRGRNGAAATPRKPLPAVPTPAHPAPALLQAATDLLADLRRHDSRAAPVRLRHRPPRPGVAAAGAGRHPRSRTRCPDRRPPARGRTPPGRPPGPPPRRPAPASAPVPGTGRPAAAPVPDAELRRLRPRLPLPRPQHALPRLPL
ncbi:conserved hypothetical protein [Streptomyces viridochromogenes DSM 40736]|uniref:DNA-binding protein n=1 Tax=Streptomyces viridochromogenes (strain DSM 40736 / JCM 4977 / BCRC 1201 / Tue 494) TaxID=591159 RepID=D9XD04_STRVT|nr:conserved hypothetical protein [Streptomyces viridochromogenes DSM 40736]